MAQDMRGLISVAEESDIPSEYRGTPVGLLLEYHNLGRPFETYGHAQILIGMCMDNRKSLRIPANFAYIIRTGGGNVGQGGFYISYAVAVGGVRSIALLGHDACGMSGLAGKREKFVNGLVEGAGWSREKAERHFADSVPVHEVGDEIDFVRAQASRLKRDYPSVQVAPLFYKIAEGMLYCVA